MIETRNLTKIYPVSRGLKRLLAKSPVTSPVLAVDNVTLAVRQGELFGVLGPNGAGKTTLIKMLCTLLRPTAGHASIGGCDVVDQEDDVRRFIGLVSSEEKSFYWRLTGRQNLIFFGRLQNMPSGQLPAKVDRILELVGLRGAADNMVYTYSSGMRQKLCLARGLLNDPKVLFLDEPMKAVDPVSAIEIKQLIRHRLVDSEKRTVVMTTHRLSEAEELCDRLAIMVHGRLSFAGTIAQLKSAVSRVERYALTIADVSPSFQLQPMAATFGLVDVLAESDPSRAAVRLSFAFSNGRRPLADIIRHIDELGGRVIAYGQIEPSLEEMFIDVIRKGSEHEQVAGLSGQRLSYTA